MEVPMTRKGQIRALKLLGRSNAQIGQALGLSAATIRYHLRRQDREDGRKHRRKLDSLAPAIEHWILAHHPLAETSDAGGLVSLHSLLDWLRQEHGYDGSHRTLVRHLRRTYPGLRLRAYARAEPPVSAEARADTFGPAWVLRLLLGKVPLVVLRGLVGGKVRVAA
jgi:hypothetical protein